jgi:type VI secretion system protein ImpH
MATERGRTDRSVAQQLEAEPYRFDFYQAVSLLERMRPDATPVGEGVDATREAVRFSSVAGLDFPASDVASLDAPAGATSPWKMRVAFLGLSGVQGPLPRALTERMLGRRSRAGAIHEFLDIFHHRLVALMYRVRRKQRIGLDGLAPERSAAAPMLASVAGLNGDRLQKRLAIPDRALLRYAALLSQRPRSAIGLERMLSSYFGVHIRVRQFVGKWRSLEPDDLTRIGRSGQCQVLGENAVLGSRVWDQQGKMRLVVGPLDYARYRDFLPPGTALRRLRELTRLYLGPVMEFDTQLVLRAPEVPTARLERKGPPLLGWTSWLSSRRPHTENPRVTLSRETP